MTPAFKSVCLVTLQFAGILLLCAGTPLHPFSIWGMVLIGNSILLFFWSFLALRKSRISILPEPHQDAKLVMTGPYRFIRHPLYTTVLIGCSGLLFFHFSWSRLGIFLLLAVVLIFKLHWEETLLQRKFPGYACYKKNTARLIPYFF